MANSRKNSLCCSALLEDVATLFGVAQSQGLHNNVSLNNFGIQTQVSAKPFRWLDILALMNVDVIHKPSHDNVVLDTLHKHKESQTMRKNQIVSKNR